MAARFDWETIRAEYEAGASQSDLSRRHGVSRTAIQKRIQAENWMQDVTDAVDRVARAKVAGIVAGCNPQKRAEAIDAAATRKAELIFKHQDDWVQYRVRAAARSEDGFEGLKCNKIEAETLRIVQEGERKAHGIVDADLRPAAAARSEQDAIRDGIKEAFASVGMGAF